MKYLAMIYSDESQAEHMTDQDWADSIAAYGAYSAALAEAGVLVDANALQPSTTATSVAMRNGEMITTHGPFVEAKEQLGGYYVLNCENLDEALQWAAKCPGAQFGTIEVRPIMAIPENGLE